MTNRPSLILFCLLVFILILTTILTQNHQVLNFSISNDKLEQENAKKDWETVEKKFEDAKILLQTNRSQQALKIFTELEQQLGKNNHLIKFRLQAQIALGKNEQALKDLDELIKIYDADPDFHRLHVIAALACQKIPQADSSLKRLYKFNNRDPYNLLLTAFLLATNKQALEAQKYYSAAQKAYAHNFLKVSNTPILKNLNEKLFVKRTLHNE